MHIYYLTTLLLCLSFYTSTDTQLISFLTPCCPLYTLPPQAPAALGPQSAQAREGHHCLLDEPVQVRPLDGAGPGRGLPRAPPVCMRNQIINFVIYNIYYLRLQHCRLPGDQPRQQLGLRAQQIVARVPRVAPPPRARVLGMYV